MEWAKSPVVAGSMVCAACLVVATAVPVAPPVAEQPTKTVHAGVNLAVDFGSLASLSAIPAIQALIATGDTSGLASLDGIPAFQQFLAGGGLAAFEPDANGNGGYAALSGLNSYATGNISGIDAFSTLGATGLGDIDASSAIPVYQSVLAGGPTGGVNALGGLASVSAVDTFFGDNNGAGGVFTGGGIDALAPDAAGNGGYAALSALPVLAGTNGVLNGGGVAALSNYDALSAIPAYLDDPPPAADPSGDTNTLVAAKVAGDPAPALAKAPDGNQTPTPNAKKPTGSYAGVFTPGGSGGGIPLFGSGRGKGPDNAIRGYGDMLKKLGLNGGAPAAGAPAGGTGDPNGAAGGGTP